MPMTDTMPVVSAEQASEISNLLELAHRAAERADNLRNGQVEPDEDIQRFALLAADILDEPNDAVAQSRGVKSSIQEDADYILAALRLISR